MDVASIYVSVYINKFVQNTRGGCLCLPACLSAYLSVWQRGRHDRVSVGSLKPRDIIQACWRAAWEQNFTDAVVMSIHSIQIHEPEPSRPHSPPPCRPPERRIRLSFRTVLSRLTAELVRLARRASTRFSSSPAPRNTDVYPASCPDAAYFSRSNLQAHPIAVFSWRCARISRSCGAHICTSRICLWMMTCSPTCSWTILPGIRPYPPIK